MKVTDNIKDFEKNQINLNYDVQSRPNKVHIGLVQLSTDHTLETDWAKLINSQAMVFSTRVFYSSHLTVKDLDDISKEIETSSNLIASGLTMDVMAFGCTSASIIIGESKIAYLLTKNRNNIPATNPWTAVKAAFNYFKAKKIAVLSPYPIEVNFNLYQQLIAADFEIAILGSLGIKKDTDITKVSKLSVIQSLKKILPQSEADIVFIPCTNLRILDYIKEIEGLFDIPVITSNSVMYWHCLNLVNVKAKCPGYGKLLNS
ncbi:Asp/Glu racemase [Francisella halioticida]|uniref:Asp/Glu racemase n=1 Tax=Francisella halioticida TaxID=549298 RepID=A0ABN5B0B3_9GAMM|nr:Asp/Glu racemase [Francisella halioticida]ASG67897.1 Asp/Glu racemase [Francisella halioticida]